MMGVSSDDLSKAQTDLTQGENGQGDRVINSQDLALSGKITSSQSNIDYDKLDDSRRRVPTFPSNSFLEESTRFKAAFCMQRKLGNKEIRLSHGSHGDGVCSAATWDTSQGFTVNDSVDKGGDQQKKLQVILTDSTIKPAGVTQKLFDSKVSFADLVRVCSSQDSSLQSSKVQLGNTLLSTAHASTLVSNYLNTYRSYLDQLRKTCGRGDSVGEAISSRTCMKSAPLVLPLARMTPVFSDDSREDPEFLELLKKTTTESIRKLWPHPNKTNIVRTTGLVDANSKYEEREPMPMTVSISDTISVVHKSEPHSDNSSGEPTSDNSDSTDYKNDTLDSSDNIGQSKLLDSPTLLTDVDNGNQNLSNKMKSTNEQLLMSESGSTNSIKNSIGSIQKGLLKVPSESFTSGDNFYLHSTETPCQTSNQSAIWNDPTQQKCPNEQLGQHMKTSSLDSFLKHQQKLLQQQQLQRQILEHQQQQQRHQQQQLLEHYQQQEQQQQRQQSVNKGYGFQPSESNKGWFQSLEDNGTSTVRPRIATSNPSSTYNPMASGHVGVDAFSTGNQTNQDYYSSPNNMQGLSVHGSFGESQQASNYAEISTNSRTLKASYACLDPSSPMTLSVVPLSDYNNEGENFVLASDRQINFCQTTDEKNNCSSSGRTWAEISRSSYDNETLITPSRAGFENESSFSTTSSSSSLEDRLRRAYARTRITQMHQQADAQRQSTMQRPILKINQTLENLSDIGAFNNQPTRCGFESSTKTSLDTGYDSGNRNHLDSGYEDLGSKYRWNSLTNCSTQPDVIENTGMRNDNDDPFMQIQPNSGPEQNARVSRLYQWKQNMGSINGNSYIQAPCPVTEVQRLCSNDSLANSLLSNLQTDRDFSWNASSMSASLPIDQQPSSLGEQYMFSDSYLSKVTSYSTEQRNQATNSNPSSLHHNDQLEDSSLFFDTENSRQNAWSWKGRQGSSDDSPKLRNNTMCNPSLSQSMQILNNKILAAQSSCLSGQKSSGESEIQKGKDSDLLNEVTAEIHHADSLNKLRLNRTFSDPNSPNTMILATPHSSTSLSHISLLQQQASQKQKTDASVYKISEELEKTYLNDSSNSAPWHEMQPDNSCRHNDNCSQEFELDNNEKYVQVQNLDGSAMILTDRNLASLRSNSSSRIYTNLNKDQLDQTQSQVMQLVRSQDSQRPRMILGANSVKQSSADEKVKAEVDESNRRIREMLGLYPNKEQSSCNNPTPVRMPESLAPAQQATPLVMNGPLQGIIQQGNSHSLSTGQISKMQMAGSKIQAPMAMTQQMYCVPNILMPQQSVQQQNANRQSNLVPIQGMMTNMSSSRFPQGMIRVPFVDMSRVVYVHQMPVNINSTHPNNNHNNSSSSNPHVNTSNIITINTNENDFSANGQNDKSGRPIRPSGVKNKATFIKMRSGSEEFTVPLIGMRPSIDDSLCPRLVKTRTNPWDQDLDHDFSNSLMSKTVSMENISGLTEPSMCSSDVTVMYPELSSLNNGAMVGDPAAKTATFMQWPASADMHPEMLDMLPVRRAMPEDCGTGRLCWPEMEFLMSSREQLQSARRSNKPMGSNKANLISIIPKSNAADGAVTLTKDQRSDKLDAKFL